MSAPLVTIGICCFNAVQTIERAVRAAQAQAWPNFEIVVADDASTDKSVEKVLDLAKIDPRIRLIRHERNGGVARSRNSIVAASRGEYIMFQDDDDESMPERTSRQLAVLLQSEGNDAAFRVCFVSRIVVEGELSHTVRAIGVDVSPSATALALHILCGDPVAGAGHAGAGTMMASRETFDAVGPFDEAFRRGEEQEWLARLAIKGGSASGCAEPLLIQYVTQGRDKASPYGGWTIVMARKHKAFLKERRAYVAALLLGYQRLYASTGRPHFAKLIRYCRALLRPLAAAGRLRDRVGNGALAQD